jgi:hypothetical protein
MRKLSPTQQMALDKLRQTGDWRSSYRLRVSLATLHALEKRGLVISRGHNKVGAFWSPQTTIEWKAREVSNG